MGRLMIKNIGRLVSGDIASPVLEADAVLIENGLISKVGRASELQDFEPDQIIDVQGMTVVPGLIDSHAHPTIGDYTPRQKQIDWIESSLHGGITTLISAGEVHIPGRPEDASGTKALAILSAKAFKRFRPSGVKVLGGGLILEEGLKEEDFKEMAEQGVTHVGEIGLGRIKEPKEAAPLVKLAKKYGMIVMMHVGGTSIPGSATVTAEQVLLTDPDVVCHLNGGPTAIPFEEAEKIIRETPYALEIVHCGNPKRALQILELVKTLKALDRIIIGNDAPSGTGVIPLGILRMICFVASLGRIRAEEAIAMATGNTARVYRLKRGFIREGYEADLVVMDAPLGSKGKDALSAIEEGDIPGIAAVLIDGEVRIWVSRNTPPPTRRCKLL